LNVEIEFIVSWSYQLSEGSMFKEKRAANKSEISVSVEATTSPYDIVESIEEFDFLELTNRQKVLGLASKLSFTNVLFI